MSEVVGIARETLDTALASGDEYHPEKFVAHLRARDCREVGLNQDGSVLTEVILAPESNPGDAFRVLGVDSLPRNTSIVGTVASCPSGEVKSEDYTRFTNRGRVHIVLFPPYGRENWSRHDSDGAERGMEVLDVDFGKDDEDWDGLDLGLT